MQAERRRSTTDEQKLVAWRSRCPVSAAHYQQALRVLLFLYGLC
jgi:hypothetical protein